MKAFVGIKEEADDSQRDLEAMIAVRKAGVSIEAAINRFEYGFARYRTLHDMSDILALRLLKKCLNFTIVDASKGLFKKQEMKTDMSQDYPDLFTLCVRELKVINSTFTKLERQERSLQPRLPPLALRVGITFKTICLLQTTTTCRSLK